MDLFMNFCNKEKKKNNGMGGGWRWRCLKHYHQFVLYESKPWSWLIGFWVRRKIEPSTHRRRRRKKKKGVYLLCSLVSHTGRLNTQGESTSWGSSWLVTQHTFQITHQFQRSIQLSKIWKTYPSFHGTKLNPFPSPWHLTDAITIISVLYP